jgi:hypothetical protein
MTMRVISNPSRKILRVKLRERSFFNPIELKSKRVEIENKWRTLS